MSFRRHQSLEIAAIDIKKMLFPSKAVQLTHVWCLSKKLEHVSLEILLGHEAVHEVVHERDQTLGVRPCKQWPKHLHTNGLPTLRIEEEKRERGSSAPIQNC